MPNKVHKVKKDPQVEIEQAAADYAKHREKVAETAEALAVVIRRLVNERRGVLIEQIGEMNAARAALHDAIWSSPEWFDRPRTRVLHGVKLGYRKQPDHFVFDEAKTQALIERDFSALSPVLIKRTSRVVKGALGTLDGATLKRLKVKKHVGADEVLIKDEGSDPVGALSAWLSAE
ncbi:MAG: hypothetical protein N0C82_07305 [Candidatus Thiodiazotropha endolucinida]|nr:hypothetical protein [Candidatus Thiodiazotropha taylori]MCW4295121.1 hypothetical protein [Candidatus Thiodiazotropha endolucinida]